jgi:hypothetical protein
MDRGRIHIRAAAKERVNTMAAIELVALLLIMMAVGIWLTKSGD